MDSPENIANFKLASPRIWNKIKNSPQNMSNVKQTSTPSKAEITTKPLTTVEDSLNLEYFNSTTYRNKKLPVYDASFKTEPFTPGYFEKHPSFKLRPPTPVTIHPNIFKNPPPSPQASSNQSHNFMINPTDHHHNLMDTSPNISNLPPHIQPNNQPPSVNLHHSSQQNSDQHTDYQKYHKNQLSEITDILSNLSPKHTQNVINSVEAHSVQLPTLSTKSIEDNNLHNQLKTTTVDKMHVYPHGSNPDLFVIEESINDSESSTNSSDSGPEWEHQNISSPLPSTPSEQDFSDSNSDFEENLGQLPKESDHQRMSRFLTSSTYENYYKKRDHQQSPSVTSSDISPEETHPNHLTDLEISSSDINSPEIVHKDQKTDDKSENPISMDESQLSPLLSSAHNIQTVAQVHSLMSHTDLPQELKDQDFPPYLEEVDFLLDLEAAIPRPILRQDYFNYLESDYKLTNMDWVQDFFKRFMEPDNQPPDMGWAFHRRKIPDFDYRFINIQSTTDKVINKLWNPLEDFYAHPALHYSLIYDQMMNLKNGLNFGPKEFRTKTRKPQMRFKYSFINKKSMIKRRPTTTQYLKWLNLAVFWYQLFLKYSTLPFNKVNNIKTSFSKQPTFLQSCNLLPNQSGMHRENYPRKNCRPTSQSRPICRPTPLTFYSDPFINSKVTIQVGFPHLKVTALLDTGASASLLSWNILQKIKGFESLPIVPDKLNFKDHQNKAVPTNHNARFIPTYIGKSCFWHKWNIQDDPDQIILGADFLKANRCLIDFSLEKPIFSVEADKHFKHSIPINIETPLSRPFFSKSDFQLHALESKTVQVFLNNGDLPKRLDPWQGSLINFAPLKNTEQHFKIQGISHFNPGSMFCEIKNLHDKPISFNHKQHLGFIHKLQEMNTNKPPLLLKQTNQIQPNYVRVLKHAHHFTFLTAPTEHFTNLMAQHILKICKTADISDLLLEKPLPEICQKISEASKETGINIKWDQDNPSFCSISSDTSPNFQNSDNIYHGFNECQEISEKRVQFDPFPQTIPLPKNYEDQHLNECPIIEDKNSLQIKLLSDSAFLPTRASQGSAGFDVRAPRDYTIGPNEKIKIPLNFSILPPPNYYTQVASRSSLVLNNIYAEGGVIDRDFTGNVSVILCNRQNKQYSIQRGDKIAQLILHRITTPQVSTVSSLPQTQRNSGGFGSSDTKVNAISISSETSSFIDIEKIAEPSIGYRLPENLPTNWRELLSLQSFPEDVRDRVERILDNNADCLSLHEFDCGETDLIEFQIELKPGHTRWQDKGWPKSHIQQEKIDLIVDKMLRSNRVEPSQSDYCCNAYLVLKKGNLCRLVTNYTPLNRNSVIPTSIIPNLEVLQQKLQKMKIASILDCRSAYQSIPIHKDSRKYTAFSTGKQLLQARFANFGYAQLPALFQELIQKALKMGQYDPELGHLESYAYPYLDDVIIIENGIQNSQSPENLSLLRDRLERKTSICLQALKRAGLRVNPAKLQLFTDTVHFLGSIITGGKLSVDPMHVKTIEKMEAPKTRKQAQRLAGLVNWLSKFINNSQQLLAPFTDCQTTVKDGKKEILPFKFGPEQKLAFTKIKQIIKDLPPLSIINPDKELFIETDASLIAVGIVIFQLITEEIDGKTVIKRSPISFYSKKFSQLQQKSLSNMERELLGILAAVDRYKWAIHYTICPIVIKTDCTSLLWLLSQRGSGKAARWSQRLYELDPKVLISSIPGNRNQAADYWSRPVSCEEPELRRFKRNSTVQWNPFKDGEFLSLHEISQYVDENPQIVQRLSIFHDNMTFKSSPYQATLDRSLIDTVPFMDITKQVPALHFINRWTLFNKIQSNDCFIDLADEEFKNSGSLHNLASHNQFLTFKQIHKSQINDPTSAKIIESVQKSPNGNYKNYTLYQGLLVKVKKNTKNSLGDIKRVFIPADLIGTALAAIHSLGHPGFQTLILIVRNYYFFRNMKAKIIEFLRGCHICNILNGTSQRRKERIGNTFITSRPMELISYDIVSGFPTVHGKSCIVNFVDHFTRYRWSKALPGAGSSELIAKFIEDSIIRPMGTFKYLLSDNAMNLNNSLAIKKLAKKYAIQLLNTPVTSSRSNGRCEISNRLVTKFIKLTSRTLRANWVKSLDFCNLILNSTPSIYALSGYSPFEVLFGRKFEFNTQILPSPQQGLDVKDYMKHAKEIKEKIWNVIKEKEISNRIRNNKRLNKHKQQHDFKAGQFVYVKDTRSVVKNEKNKLRGIYQNSPYIILEIRGFIVLVKRLVDGFVQKLNCDLIKHWFPRSELYRNLPKELRQTLGEPLSEEQLRISYAKNELPKIYRMDFNNTRKKAQQQNGSQNSLEKEESQSHSSSTTISENQSLLSSPDGLSEQSDNNLANTQGAKANAGRVHDKTGSEAKTSKSFLSRLKNVSKLILPSNISHNNILPTRLRKKN